MVLRSGGCAVVVVALLEVVVVGGWGCGHLLLTLSASPFPPLL